MTVLTDFGQLGDLLRRARRARQLTQAELGAQIGASQTTVGRWENGQARPREEVLVPLASFLGMDVKEVRRLVEREEIAGLHDRLADLAQLLGALSDTLQGLVVQVGEMEERVNRQTD